MTINYLVPTVEVLPSTQTSVFHFFQQASHVGGVFCLLYFGLIWFCCWGSFFSLEVKEEN